VPLSSDAFITTLVGLSDALPRGKRMNEAAYGLLWTTFPARAKELLTPEIWLYAAAQRLLDPDPMDELPLPQQLLQYVFRLENGRPNMAWGLKADLSERMARPDLFHVQPVPGQLPAAPEPPVTNPLLQEVRW
jgi:hypothetical protein